MGMGNMENMKVWRIGEHGNGRVHGVVELLEKGAEQDGEEKQQKLLPDHAFDNAVVLFGQVVHCGCRPFPAGVEFGSFAPAHLSCRL